MNAGVMVVWDMILAMWCRHAWRPEVIYERWPDGGRTVRDIHRRCTKCGAWRERLYP